jgi:hypothetical protein
VRNSDLDRRIGRGFRVRQRIGGGRPNVAKVALARTRVFDDDVLSEG